MHFDAEYVRSVRPTNNNNNRQTPDENENFIFRYKFSLFDLKQINYKLLRAMCVCNVDQECMINGSEHDFFCHREWTSISYVKKK